MIALLKISREKITIWLTYASPGSDPHEKFTSCEFVLGLVVRLAASLSIFHFFNSIKALLNHLRFRRNYFVFFLFLLSFFQNCK